MPPPPQNGSKKRAAYSALQPPPQRRSAIRPRSVRPLHHPFTSLSSCHDLAKALVLWSKLRSRAEGSFVFSTVSSTPVCSCGRGVIADRRRIFAFLRRGRARRRLVRVLRRRRRYRGPVRADRRRGRGRRCASSSPRKSRSTANLSLIAPDGRVAAKSREPAGRAAVFLVRRSGRRRPRARGSATLTARRRCSTITRDIAVRDASRRRRARRRAASGRCATAGTAPRKICIRRGSRNCSTRRSTRSRRGRRCTRCCATARAICCSTIWARRRRSDDAPISPDCADLVYFLRAYFAFKMGLPFGYSSARAAAAASRRSATRWFDQCAMPRPRRAPAAGAGGVRSARISARWSPTPCSPAPCASPANDDNTDFYTVPLTQQTLRPGTVYADPYGHVLMLVRRVPQIGRRAPASSSRSTASRTARSRASASGAAISCSPTIPRSAAPASSASGRSCATRTARLRRLTNAEIAKNPQYGDFSLEQSKLGGRRVLRPHGRRDVAASRSIRCAR